MLRNRWLIYAVSSMAFACTSGTPAAPQPQLLMLENLIQMASAGEPYLATPEGQTVIPMTAVVTPPGLDIFFQEPPYGSTGDPFVNTNAGPILNLLPAVSQGHFTPYVTVEMWTNNFGPVWVQPFYWLIEVDSSGNWLNTTPPAGQLVNPEAPGEPANPIVLSVAPPDRFYTPFWRARNVLVPQSDWAQVMAHPPTSERDVLDMPYPILDSTLELASIVPADLAFDAPLIPPSGTSGGTMPLPAPPTGFAPWMAAILNADYTAAGLEQFETLPFVSTVFNGQPLTAIYFGDDWFTEGPGNVAPNTPIYEWADLDENGNPVPLGLPSIAGIDAPFSGAPADAPDEQPDWDAFWQLYYVIRPTECASPPCAIPFYPVVPSATDPTNVPDLFAGQRLQFTPADMPAPSAAVNALPNVARYAGRVALNPSCFFATPSPDGGAGSSSATAEWAATCQFMDSQAALEANLSRESFIETETQILCPLMLWAPHEGQVNP